MIQWLLNILTNNGRVGLNETRELSQHRLHTTKYEDLCMQGDMLQFLGPIANLAGTWLENKVEKTKADGQAKVAEAKARATVAKKVAAGEVEWEGKMAEATDNSWKDEFALVVLLTPAVLVFIPGIESMCIKVLKYCPLYQIGINICCLLQYQHLSLIHI